ncbi:MAG: hypothetical protein KDB00_14440, partial [Planctomycetales bacterium]|nr:hypothetical protein [Planctomycetales bacterium]
PVCSGTKYCKYFVWLSADPVYDRLRASFLGEVYHVPEGPLNPGESRQVTLQTVWPQGTDGDYYLHIHLNAQNDYPPSTFPLLARRLLPDVYPASSGTNNDWLNHFSHWAFEDTSDNIFSYRFPITYHEADLQVTDFQIPTDATSGDTITVSYTVTNNGTRATRVNSWLDRLFLSHDASLDSRDYLMASYSRPGMNLQPPPVLDVGESYTATFDAKIPEGIEGDFHLLLYVDSAAKKSDLVTSDIGFDLRGIDIQRAATLFPWDLASRSSRELARGAIAEYQQEGNNLIESALTVHPAAIPDLQTTAINVVNRAFVGQEIDVTYTVTNVGAATPLAQSIWKDLIYLSRDEYLDLQADRYLGAVDYRLGLGAGESYTKTTTVTLPEDLIGPYFVFVVTDPVYLKSGGDVFEGPNERNNSRASDVPLVIELPPSSDLQITSIVAPGSVKAGEPLEIRWTVTNNSNETATGTWSDSVFFSSDSSWDIRDKSVGRVTFRGTLGPGESYTSILNTTMPAITPGSYRVIVRADIFNQVYEAGADANNDAASPNIVAVTAEELQLGVPLSTALNVDQEMLFQVVVPLDRTLRVNVKSDRDDTALELYLRQGTAPTSTAFDAASQGRLTAEQVAVIPSTSPGIYYILVRGFSVPQDGAGVTVLADLVPLAITDVSTDVGGDARYVTTTIRGARFSQDAIVKLVRPGFAEFDPVNYEVVDATKIIATFDFEGAPHGLYDLKVINPSGDEAVIPYRFLIERAIEPDVTIGVGGPRIIFAGDTGTYSVALQNLGNIDAPYTYFNVGIPELGVHEFLYNLPYVSFFSNLRGSPEGGGIENLPWASLNSAVNTDGNINAGGFLYDEPADGFTGFTFDVLTYAGLRELHDHAFESLKEALYKANPAMAEQDLLAAGPEALDLISPGLYLIYQLFSEVPNISQIPVVPFQFHVVASATSMTRDEYIAFSLNEANVLRTAIINDPNAPAALATLAADETNWTLLFMASLEEAGLLRGEDALPPIRENSKLVSLMATLSSGILAGPAGEETLTIGSATDFFKQVRTWYGHDATLEAPTDPDAPRFQGDSLSFLGLLDNYNPVAVIPGVEDLDLGLSRTTYSQSFRVYVPWVPWEKRGSGIPADYQIRGVIPQDQSAFVPFNLEPYYNGPGVTSGAASTTGPFTVESDGFVPVGQALPFTVQFQNDPNASSYSSEIRVATDLDPNLDPRSFRLGDIKVGDITVRIPEGRSLFQGEFDFVDSLGFVLRVSAGVDLTTNSATWLLQAIDPLTGELVRNPNIGLLRPNNAQSQGAGFVSFSIEASEAGDTGSDITSTSRVLLNNAPPEDTPPLVYQLDAAAPATQLDIHDMGGADFMVRWNSVDDEGGSGFKHVTLYVSEDGGTFKIWKRQVEESTGEAIYEGRVGHTYEFLALATDRAGNRESVPSGAEAQDDGSARNLGSLPNVGQTTSPNFGVAPQPTPQPSTNPLFTQAESLVPADLPTVNRSEFQTVLQPFQAAAFATNFVESHAGIGPMALAESPDGSILVSGGPSRNQLFRFDRTGGTADQVLSELGYPIFALSFDAEGRLWAVTGGGPLLRLDPATGTEIASYGDGLTMAIAIEPTTGLIYVSGNRGVEIFDPESETFTHFSRDRDLRVGGLAFAKDGSLWATTWPDRSQVVRFTDRARAEVMLTFDTPIDSLAFGQSGTSLEDLLFVSHNLPGTGRGSELTLVDVKTLRQVSLARGGTRGDVIITTSDGRVLLSQSSQVDVLNPIAQPHVVSTNPAPQTIVALPLPLVTVTFDQDMFVGSGNEPMSVINPINYRLTNKTGHSAVIRSIRYDSATRTALISAEVQDPGEYVLVVEGDIAGGSGFTLGPPYATEFTVVGDLSPFVDIDFTTSRLDRSTQQVTYEVTVTNTATFELLLPMFLSLGPVRGDGIPENTDDRTTDGRWLISLQPNLPDGVRLGPGESTVARTVHVTAEDFAAFDFDASIVAVSAANEKPFFTTTAPTTVSADDNYFYMPTAQDNDGTVVAYLLRKGPTGMTIDPVTGLVRWQTSVNVPASADVWISAFDNRGSWVSQQWTIDVVGGNRAPVFDLLPSIVDMTESQDLVVPVVATDPDGNALTYWAEHLPPLATFDPTSHTLYWDPNFEAAGTYRDVRFYVSDGVNTISHSLDLFVPATDRPPTLVLPREVILREGVLYVTQVGAIDDDGDSIKFTSSSLPQGAKLNALTGRFEWMPGFDAAGEHQIPITATSNGVSVTETLTLDVLNANAAPVFEPLDGISISEGQPLTLRPFAFDP